MEKEPEQILAKSSLCKGMTKEEIQEILSQNGCRICHYDKGETIFLQGQKADRMFVLVSGKVVIAKVSASGKKSVLTCIETVGDLFGEIYLFIGKREFEMEAQAVVSTTVLSIDSRIFEKEADNSMAEIRLMKNLLQIFAKKAYLLNKRLRLLSAGSLREKIASFLLEHASEDGMVYLSMTKEELAEYMNVARPSLSREIGNMVEEGWIALQGKNILIRDLESLEDLL